jgi:hypothetical protein
MMSEAGKNGYSSVSELTRALKYKSTEKLYRLKRSNDNKPSFTIIEDLTNLFDSIDLEYLVTGKRTKYEALNELNNAEEVTSVYKTKVELLKSLFNEGGDDINKKIDDVLTNQIKILDLLNKGVHLDSIKNERENSEN